jgi:hypothetical protein
MPSSSFSFDTFFKFTESPKLGDRVLALRSASLTVSITIDVNFENVPNFAVTAGSATGRTVTSRVAAPHEWWYIGIAFNNVTRMLSTYVNDFTLANPIMLAAGFQPTTLILGDNAPLLVDFARFSPGYSAYLTKLYDWADYTDALVTHAPLLTFDSASGPVVVAPRGGASQQRTLADVSAGGDVTFVGLCAARQNFAVRVPTRSVAVNARRLRVRVERDRSRHLRALQATHRTSSRSSVCSGTKTTSTCLSTCSTPRRRPTPPAPTIFAPTRSNCTLRRRARRM